MILVDLTLSREDVDLLIRLVIRELDREELAFARGEGDALAISHRAASLKWLLLHLEKQSE